MAGSGSDQEHASAAPVTMADVAKAAGVSRATVSRTLSGSTAVSDSVRRAVNDAVARLGYVPNVMAQALAARSSDTLGLLLRDPRVPAYGLLHSELQHHVSRLGMQMISAVPDIAEGEAHERTALDRLIGLRVAGLIVATGLLSSELIEPVARRLPVVVVGRPERHDGVYAVSYDEADNARQLAEAVIRYGHRRVAVVGAQQGTESLRVHAIAETLREGGAAPTVLLANFFGTQEDHCDTVIDLVRKDEITAVMFASDRRLIRFLVESKRAGLSIPDDVSATGCDGIIDSADLLGLTTVRLPVERAARRAITIMRAMLSDRATVAVHHERVRGSFVPGRTLVPVG